MDTSGNPPPQACPTSQSTFMMADSGFRVSDHSHNSVVPQGVPRVLSTHIENTCQSHQRCIFFKTILCITYVLWTLWVRLASFPNLRKRFGPGKRKGSRTRSGSIRHTLWASQDSLGFAGLYTQTLKRCSEAWDQARNAEPWS